MSRMHRCAVSLLFIWARVATHECTAQTPSAGPRISSLASSGPINATSGQVISG